MTSFDRNAARGRVDPLATPLPPVLAELVADRAEAVEHHNAVERLAEMRAAVGQAQRKLERARAADDQAERESVRSGKPFKPTAGKAAEELERAQHRERIAGELLAEAADRLLGAAQPLAGDALTKAAQLIEEAHDQAAQLIEQASAELARGHQAEREYGWVYGLAHGNGRPRNPFTAHGGATTSTAKTAASLDEARHLLPMERQARAERLERSAADRKAAGEYERQVAEDRLKDQERREQERAERAAAAF